MTRTLRLSEYIPSEPYRLEIGVRDRLVEMIPGLTIQPARGEVDAYVVTSGSTVGVARVGDLLVELRPKVGVAPLVFLASYALDPSAWRPEDAPLATDANIAEALVPLFARATQHALRAGLLHGYRRREDTLSAVRGRVRFVDQFRAHAGLPLPVEVTYDDFTPDILENRLLRSAVDVLGRLHLRQPSSRAMLARLHQELNGISSVVFTGGVIPEPHWTRLNDRYRPAVSLARMLIGGAGLEANAGGELASSFLLDMNRLFENFIREALRERLGLTGRAFPSGSRGHGVYLDTERLVPLKPDLSWWVSGRCVFVGDCKYKRTDGNVPNSDIYQALAYLTALELGEGLLVYGAGEDVGRSVTICHAGKRLYIRTVDVSRAPAEVLSQVAELAKLVEEMVERHLASVDAGQVLAAGL